MTRSRRARSSDPPLPAGEGRGEGRPLLERARRLRKRQSDCEALLWRELRSRRFAGFKFRRQYPIAGYIVDFFCVDAQLAIELDGGQHATQRVYDEARERELIRAGVRVVRFWNSDVLQNLDGVLAAILVAAGRYPPLTPTFSPRGGSKGSKELFRAAMPHIPLVAIPPHPDPLPPQGERGENAAPQW